MATAKSQVDILINAKDQTNRAFKSVSGNLKKLGGAASRAGAVATAAMAGIGAGVFTLAKKAGKFNSVKDSLGGLSKQFDTSASDIVKSVRKATGGTVSDFDIMNKSVKAMSLIGKESFDSLGGDFDDNFSRMAVVAKKAARATGQDVEYMFDSIVTGVGRASPMIVDNLGIVLDAEKAYDDYAKTLNKSSSELTKGEKKSAILNQVLAKGEEQYKDVAVSAGGLTGALQKTKATWENVSVSVGNLFAPAMTRASEKINEFMENAKKSFERVTRPESVQVLDNMGIHLSENEIKIKEFIEKTKQDWEEMKEWIGEKIQQIREKMDPYTQKFQEWITAGDNFKEVMTAIFIALGIVVAIFAIKVAIAMAPILIVFGLIVAVVYLIRRAWDENWGGIQEKTKAVIDFIKMYYTTFLIPMFEILKQKLVEFWEKWGWVWDVVKVVFKQVWNTIKTLAKIAWAYVSGIFKIGMAIFKGDWGKAWEEVKTMFSTIWETIKEFLGETWENIKSAAETALNGLLNIFTNKLNEMWDKAKEIAKKIRKAISSAFDKKKRNSPSIEDRINEVVTFASEKLPQVQVPKYSQEIAGEIAQVRPAQSGQAPQTQPQQKTNNVFNFNFSGAFIGNKEIFIEEIKRAVNQDDNRRVELNTLGVST